MPESVNPKFAAAVGLFGQEDDTKPTPITDCSEFEAFVWSAEFEDYMPIGKVVKAETARRLERSAR